MLILALDSTAVAASVALCDGEKMLANYTVNLGNTHSETLLPMVEAVLKSAKITAADIDLFAASAGPGSFTGVRIGAATVKGLAFGKDKPCIGVSTLEALAYNLIGFDGIACPVMNARRAQVYNALFEVDGKGALCRLTPDRAIAISELEDELLSQSRTIYLSGDGYEITRDGFSRLVTKDTPAILIPQNAYSVAMCALGQYEAGVRTTDIELSPVYLRLSQAERKRAEKEKNSTGI
ncbi:MAG: tRNA (adenosine(37)-N6)-threonylcarbamoyltransferase complex dimerization subunit type 1 TsaB [Clostridia bacterium]|nr:tRNA (adenosine(37)-N6)-threonylcarbamoyltransferase complex dimerization subunit type 1 TsaB [Clostridia bacterium]